MSEFVHSDENRFCSSAYALDLAAKLAGPVCQSPNLESAMIQKLNQVEFPDAITQDAREVLSAENNPTMKNLSKSLLLRARL